MGLGTALASRGQARRSQHRTERCISVGSSSSHRQPPHRQRTQRHLLCAAQGAMQPPSSVLLHRQTGPAAPLPSSHMQCHSPACYLCNDWRYLSLLAAARSADDHDFASQKIAECTGRMCGSSCQEPQDTLDNRNVLHSLGCRVQYPKPQKASFMCVSHTQVEMQRPRVMRRRPAKGLWTGTSRGLGSSLAGGTSHARFR